MSGGKRHKAQQGESVESIAHAAGHFWQTVWEHPENAALRELRKSPHVIHPGDVVFVPDLREKKIGCATGMQHPFRRKGVPSRLKVRFLVDDEPRAGASYELFVDGTRQKEGATDGDGWLDEPISPTAALAEVHFAAEEEPDEPPPGHFEEDGADVVREAPPPEAKKKAPARKIVYSFALRRLDPASEVSGAKGRLRHLGYAVGDPDAELDARTEEALRAFQTDHELEVTGALDDATQAKLREFADG